MVKPANSKDTAFLLEEVFQLLRESLELDPFKQSKHQPTKKHIARFRDLLGPEFSFLLAETGNLFYSVLHTAEVYIDQEFSTQNSYVMEAMQLYTQLLLTSRLVMCTSMQSEQTINAIVELNQLTGEDKETIHEVIDSALEILQKNMCKLASL